MGFFKKFKKTIKGFKNPIKSELSSKKKLFKGNFNAAFKEKKSGDAALRLAEGARDIKRDTVIGVDDYLKNNPEVAGAVGTAVGFYFGGPAGAAAGASLTTARANHHTGKVQAKEAKAAEAEANRLFREQTDAIREAGQATANALEEDEAAALAGRNSRSREGRRRGLAASIVNQGGAGGITNPRVRRGGILG